MTVYTLYAQETPVSNGLSTISALYFEQFSLELGYQSAARLGNLNTVTKTHPKIF